MVGYLKGIELNFMKGDRGLNARTAPMYIKLLIISSLTLLHVMFLFFQNKSIGILYHLSKLKLNVNWSSWMTKVTLRVIREAKTFSKKSCFLSFINAS